MPCMFNFSRGEWVNFEERQLNMKGNVENESGSLLKEEKLVEKLRIQQL